MDKNAKVVLMSKIESILFVCLGNICRSPLAEGIARDLAQKRGLELKIDVQILSRLLENMELIFQALEGEKLAYMAMMYLIGLWQWISKIITIY